MTPSIIVLQFCHSFTICDVPLFNSRSPFLRSGCLLRWDWFPVYDNEPQLYHHWLDNGDQQSQQWSLSATFRFFFFIFRFYIVDLVLCCNFTVFTLNHSWCWRCPLFPIRRILSTDCRVWGGGLSVPWQVLSLCITLQASKLSWRVLWEFTERAGADGDAWRLCLVRKMLKQTEKQQCRKLPSLYTCTYVSYEHLLLSLLRSYPKIIYSSANSYLDCNKQPSFLTVEWNWLINNSFMILMDISIIIIIEII